MAIKQPRILFFIDGAVPTPSNRLEANAYKGKGAIVAFRNSRYVRGDQDGGAELADGVMGAVIPEQYAKYPTADEAVAKYATAMQAEADAAQAAADKRGGTQDNNGLSSVSDPHRRPVAAPTQPAPSLQPIQAQPGTAEAATAAAAGPGAPAGGTINPFGQGAAPGTTQA